MFLNKIPNLFSRLSLRVKLILIFVGLFGSMTLIFDHLSFNMIVQALDDENDINLYNLAVEYFNADETSNKTDGLSSPGSPDKKKIFPFRSDSILVQIRQSSGRILFQQGDFGKFTLPDLADYKSLLQEDQAIYDTISNTDSIPNAESETYRMISFPWKTPDSILQIAVPRTHIEVVMTQRNRILLIGIPSVLLIAGLGGFFLSGRAIKPVQSMISIAREIDGSELTQRVPLPNSEDEIKELAQTFNEMLSRIQLAFESQERFVADASHQLLTPLSLMKTELELNLRSTENPAGDKNPRGLLKNLLQEVDFLTRIVLDMLLLARIDAGTGALQLQLHHLDELTLEAFERVEKIALKKGVILKFDLHGLEIHRPQIRGDRDLLIHLVTNLLENAIKFSKSGQTVSVRLMVEKDLQRLIVKDQGPGIPPDQFESIFQRFSRGPKTSTQVKGYGLGLAIAKKIASLHEARLITVIPTTSPSGEDPGPNRLQSQPESPGAEFHFEIKTT